MADPTTAISEDALAQERKRADQLQQALTSRLTLEQAKGILRERFGLTPDQAFNLLRNTARHNRQSIHQLADQIVSKPDTPSQIIQTLARTPTHPHQHGVDRLGRHVRLDTTHRKAQRLRDDAQALKAQADVQMGRAKRHNQPRDGREEHRRK